MSKHDTITAIVEAIHAADIPGVEFSHWITAGDGTGTMCLDLPEPHYLELKLATEAEFNEQVIG